MNLPIDDFVVFEPREGSYPEPMQVRYRARALGRIVGETAITSIAFQMEAPSDEYGEVWILTDMIPKELVLMTAVKLQEIGLRERKEGKPSSTCPQCGSSAYTLVDAGADELLWYCEDCTHRANALEPGWILFSDCRLDAEKIKQLREQWKEAHERMVEEQKVEGGKDFIPYRLLGEEMNWVMEVGRAITSSPKTRLWRTLIRVDEVYDSYVILTLSGWSSYQHVRLYYWEIPNEIWPLLKPNKRLHAWVNIGAEHEEDLRFERWECG